MDKIDESDLDSHIEDAELMRIESPELRKEVKNKMNFTGARKTLQEILGHDIKTDGEMENKTLDPNHPLMVRFQKGLKEHLLKLHEETDSQMNELNKAISDQEKGKEELGVQLYGLQKELVHQKNILNKIHEDYKKLEQGKTDVNKNLEEAKVSHESFNKNLLNSKEKEHQLRKDMEDLAMQVMQLTSIQMESAADSFAMKRAAEKTAKDKENLVLQKLRQDILISRFEEDRHHLEERIALYRAQCSIKKEEASGLRKELTEAKAEMQTVHYEKIKLMQQWRYSITALEKRDDTCSVMRESVRLSEEEMHTLNMDILAHKKSVKRELERNEKLTHLLLYRDAEVMRLKKSINDSRSKQQAMQEEYSLYDRTVHEVESNLESLNLEKDFKEKELKEKCKQIEKAYITKRELDDKCMEIIHNKITLTKAAKYTKRLINELHKEVKKKANTMVSKENEITKLNLDVINRNAHIEAMQQTLGNLNEEIDAKDKTITKAEESIARGHADLEKKQVVITDLNKKLDAIISSAGGMELGPLEREISNVKKEIVVCEEARRNMEQEWLRFQTELVTVTTETTSQQNEVDLYNRRLAILEEKKIRLEANIAKEEKEVREVELSLNALQTDVLRINTLLYQEKDQQKRLQLDTQLLQTEFAKALKEAELDCYKKELEVENLKKEKERLVNLLIESQRETVLWDGKLQVADETRKMLKMETQDCKVLEMKSEIRRLQVRLQQIKKEEEDLIQNMEKAVMTHVNLYTKVEVQLLRGIKKESAQYMLKKMERMHKKILQDVKELDQCEAQMQSEEAVYSELMKKIRETENFPFQLTAEMEVLGKDTKVKQREKLKNLILLSLKQKKTKYLQSIKEEKYVPVIKNEAKRSTETKKIREQIEIIQNITENVSAECPSLSKDCLKTLDFISVADAL